MKKTIPVVLILALALEVVGCETIQRKFTRKKKRTPIRPRFYQEGGMADTRPHLELYMMHYMYWKTWHEDLMEKAGENAKRDTFACNEIIANLTDMRKHLEEAKAKELDVYIEQVKKIADEIKSGGSTLMRLGLLKQKLDKIKMRIVRNFYYKKIKDYIKLD